MSLSVTQSDMTNVTWVCPTIQHPEDTAIHVTSLCSQAWPLNQLTQTSLSCR